MSILLFRFDCFEKTASSRERRLVFEMVEKLPYGDELDSLRAKLKSATEALFTDKKDTAKEWDDLWLEIKKIKNSQRLRSAIDELGY